MGDPVTMDAKEQAKITVLVVGAGPAGLINARTLVEDGLEVTMVCKVCCPFFEDAISDLSH